MEIWTAKIWPKIGSDQNNLNNFPPQTTRKLTKSGLNGDRLYKVLIQISLSEENQKSGLNKDTFLKCPELGTMS
jgi:hypothetical protein